MFPVLSSRKEKDHIIEIIETGEMTVHMPYAIQGYPEKKVLHGNFLQIYKGMKRAEGSYISGKKHGVWLYYMNNPHHPISKEYFDQEKKIKQEIFYPDGHHIRTVFTYDTNELLLKQIHYDPDGKTINKLDIYSEGILKEENQMTDKGQKQTVYIYDDKKKIKEKQHFLNDQLVSVDKIRTS